MTLPATPAQVDAMFLPGPTDRFDPCTRCGALVPVTLRAVHYEWHLNLQVGVLTP